MGLTPHQTNSWNPTKNAVIERIDQFFSDGLWAFDLEGPEIDPDEDDHPFNEYLAAVLCAICSAFHQTHGYLPAQMVFGRDMFLDALAEIDWDNICQQKQQKIGISNRRENRNRTEHTYSAGDLILIKKPGIPTPPVEVNQDPVYWGWYKKTQINNKEYVTNWYKTLRKW